MSTPRLAGWGQNRMACELIPCTLAGFVIQFLNSMPLYTTGQKGKT